MLGKLIKKEILNNWAKKYKHKDETSYKTVYGSTYYNNLLFELVYALDEKKDYKIDSMSEHLIRMTCEEIISIYGFVHCSHARMFLEENDPCLSESLKLVDHTNGVNIVVLANKLLHKYYYERIENIIEIIKEIIGNYDKKEEKV